MPTSVFHTSSYPVERHFTDVLDSFTSPYGMFLLFFPVNTMDRGHFPLTRTTPSHIKWGGQGAGDREKRGREVYGRREKRGREAGFPLWPEVGEKGKNYATLRNISQSKKCKGAGANKYGAGTGIKGYGKREV